VGVVSLVDERVEPRTMGQSQNTVRVTRTKLLKQKQETLLHQVLVARRRLTSQLMTMSATWRHWRHCCCRYGWYPVLIVPVITSSSLLSLYSSFGCDFVRLEVGFTPSNQAWNQSSAKLGLFYMNTGYESDNQYEQNLLEGCEWYSDEFEYSFIEGDRTWKVARIMALIAGAAGITATVEYFTLLRGLVSCWLRWRLVALYGLTWSNIVREINDIFLFTR
jgi:hypothetical protein